MDNLHKSYNAEDRSYLALLKKEIHLQAADIFRSTKRLGEMDIVVSEIATNLVKHAKGGEILVKKLDNDKGIEIIGIDHGPGILDIARMMVDGVSTKNTLGQGLGAIKRLCDFFQIYSLEGWGTIIVARVYNHDFPGECQKEKYELRSLLVAKAGEKKCGDNYLLKTSTDTLMLFLGDGLGHGDEAALAVNTAITAVDWQIKDSLPDLIRKNHEAIRKTRGMVATIARYKATEKSWEICGLGNILTRIVQPLTTKNYSPYNGLIGMNIPETLDSQTIQVEGTHLMVMCSDGLTTRWDLQKYPNITRYDPSILAAAIYKDNCRKTDDSSVVVVKIN